MSDQAAWVIGHIRVKDETKWMAYRSQVPATLEPWGAELIFRGRCSDHFRGQHEYPDTVVIRFPDTSAMRGWFNSAEYQALTDLRNEAAEVLLLGYEDA